MQSSACFAASWRQSISRHERERQVVDAAYRVHTVLGRDCWNRLTMLINFNVTLIKQGIPRIVNGLKE
jgi:hypothetical protein